jgi:predicted hydrocarbon binding protein
MTIERILGFIAGTILFGIGSRIGACLIEKAEERMKKAQEEAAAQGRNPAAPSAV